MQRTPIDVAAEAGPAGVAGGVEQAYLRWARYHLVQALAQGKRILELGCGDGRGAAYLAEVAAKVDAVDDADATIAQAAAANQGSEGLAFVRARPEAFAESVAEGSYDLVLAFDLLPLFDKRGQSQLLRAVRRALAPGGLALFSSADRQVVVDARGFRGAVQDMYRRDLVSRLEEVFPAVRLLEQRVYSGSAIFSPEAPTASVVELAWDDPDSGTGHLAPGPQHGGEHVLAAAALKASDLDAVGSTVLVDASRLLLRHALRDQEVEHEVVRRDLQLARREAEAVRQDAANARRDVEGARRQLELARELAEQQRAAAGEQEKARQQHLDAARAELDQLKANWIPRERSELEKKHLHDVIDRLLTVLQTDAVELDRTLRAEAELLILRDQHHRTLHELNTARAHVQELRQMVSMKLVAQAKKVWDRAPRLKAMIKGVVRPLVR